MRTFVAVLLTLFLTAPASAEVHAWWDDVEYIGMETYRVDLLVTTAPDSVLHSGTIELAWPSNYEYDLSWWCTGAVDVGSEIRATSATLAFQLDTPLQLDDAPLPLLQTYWKNNPPADITILPETSFNVSPEPTTLLLLLPGVALVRRRRS